MPPQNKGREIQIGRPSHRVRIGDNKETEEKKGGKERRDSVVERGRGTEWSYRFPRRRGVRDAG